MDNKMLIEKIRKESLDEAFYIVCSNGNYFIETRENLKEKAMYYINSELINVAMAILEGLSSNTNEYFEFDWSTPDVSPTPIETVEDLIRIIEG